MPIGVLSSYEKLLLYYTSPPKKCGKQTAIHSFYRLTCFCKIQANND